MSDAEVGLVGGAGALWPLLRRRLRSEVRASRQLCSHLATATATATSSVKVDMYNAKAYMSYEVHLYLDVECI